MKINNSAIKAFLAILFVVATSMSYSDLTAQEAFTKVTIGDQQFESRGESNNVYIDFGKNEFGMYGVVDFEKLDDPEGVIVSYHGALEIGTYELLKNEGKGMLKIVVNYQKEGKSINSTTLGGGSLNITDVSGGYVTGTFSYTGVHPDSEAEVLVEGSFKVKEMKI